MSAAIPDLLAAAPAVRACQAALGARDGIWIVGGAIRDAAFGREVRDVDLAVARDEGQAAREIGAFAAGHAFKLSEEFASWRALAGDAAWHVDITRLRGDRSEADQDIRELTVNAIEVPLA